MTGFLKKAPVQAGNASQGNKSAAPQAKRESTPPVKSLIYKKGKDADKFEDITGLWEHTDKNGNTYYRGKAKDGTTYAVFSRKAGIELVKDSGDGFKKVVALTQKDNGNLTGSIENGPLYVISDAKPKKQA